MDVQELLVYSKFEIQNCFFKFPAINDYYIESNKTHLKLHQNASTLVSECNQMNDLLESIGVYGNLTLLVVITIGLLLNLFILSVLVLDSTKTSSDYYLMSIAIGDTAICVGTFITSQLARFYELGNFATSVGNIIGNLGMFACLSTVMALTIERYFAVKDPMSTLYMCTRERSVKVALVTWACLVVYCTVAEVLTYKIPFPEDEHPIHETRIYALFYVNFTLFYIIPVGVSLALYLVILKIIQERERNLKKLLMPERSAREMRPSTSCARKQLSVTSTKTSSFSMQAGKDEPSGKKVKNSSSGDVDERIGRLLSLRKMMRMFVLVLVSFVLLMSPYRWLTLGWSLYTKLAGERLVGWSHFYHRLLLALFSILYACNSIVDPILYNILAKRFRGKVQNIVSKLRMKLQRRQQFQPAKQCVAPQRLNRGTSVNLGIAQRDSNQKSDTIYNA